VAGFVVLGAIDGVWVARLPWTAGHRLPRARPRSLRSASSSSPGPSSRSSAHGWAVAPAKPARPL